jgi:hypothetical protein
MYKNSERKKGSVILLLRSKQLNLITRLMLTCLGEHVESSPDFVFQKLYIQIIRRLSAYFCICGDRKLSYHAGVQPEIEGAIVTEEFQFKTASTCRSLQT